MSHRYGAENAERERKGSAVIFRVFESPTAGSGTTSATGNNLSQRIIAAVIFKKMYT